jgi:chitodextrinase
VTPARRRGALAAVLAAAALAATATPAAATGTGAGDCRTRPHLTGSFIQPDLPDGWTAAQWRQELRVLTRACIDQQILQWTVDSRAHTAIYPTSLPGYRQNTGSDVVGAALAAADRAGVQEYVGLQINDDWWTHYANDRAWLAGEAATAVALADDLWRRYGQHRSFAGWYLSFEVDNVNFPDQSTWDTMAGFYRTVAGHLHAISPGRPVATSPFFNAAFGLSTAQWQQMWTSILGSAPLDILAMQDGVGVGHATAADLPAWFAATRAAIAAGRPRARLLSDTETFDADNVSMPIAGIVADMRAVAPYVRGLWSFAYDHYQSPGQADPSYDRAYRAYLRTGRVEHTPPSTPAALAAVATGPLTVALSWQASTDASGVIGYRIYRDDTLVRTVYGAASTAVDAGVDPSSTYRYAVRALDPAGNVSAASDTATVTTPAAPVYPVNLALGRPYTVDIPADDSYPDAGGELTDGSYASTDFTEAGWQGRVTGDYTITVDLGATATIREISSDWLQSLPVGILLPSAVDYAVSTDGVSYTAVGSVPGSAVGDTDRSRRYRVIQLDTRARYVRVLVHPNSDNWSFADEVEVRTDAA